MRPFIVTLFLALSLAGLPAMAQPYDTPAGVTEADAATQLLLMPDEQGSGLVETVGGAKVTAKGATIIDDQRWGKVISLGQAEGNSIALRQLDKLDYANGFTIEAMVRLSGDDAAKFKGGVFALSGGSFALGLSDKHSLDIAWLKFPTVSVVTTTDKQFKYYPVNTDGFGGWYQLPAGRWTHIAITYDPGQAVIRTWVDGSMDRERYLSKVFYPADQPIQLGSNPSQPLTLFQNMRGLDVAAVRISGVARRYGPTHPLEAYVHQLPYTGESAVHFTRFEKGLSFPLDATITWEAPHGGSNVIQRFTLDDASDRVVRFKPPGWNNDYYTLTIRVSHQQRELYARTTHVTNGLAAKGSRHHIDKDKILSIDGKKIFPLMVYHVFKEDFKDVAGLGFNIASARAPVPSAFMGIGIRGQANIQAAQETLDAAKEAGLFLSVSNRIGGSEMTVRFADHSALGLWYTYDEPWSITMSKVLNSYNLLKLTHPDTPVVVAQNNLTRMHETAEGVDILMTDPYPIPNVSLRTVADTTKYAVTAVAGLKPVWTAVCQYGGKQPTADELRCMVYLALTSGANGVAIYAWDDRVYDRKTQQLTGWYTKENAADLAILRQVMGEITPLSNVLMVPNVPDAVAVTDANPAIHASVKVVDGKKHLLLANDSRQEESVNLRISGVGSAVARRLSSTGDSLQVVDGVLSATFKPLESAVYILE